MNIPQALTFSQVAFVFVLVIICLLVLRTLIHRDKCLNSQINLEDLLIGDDGKLSKAAAVMFGAFVLSTWVIVNLTMTGRLTEGYYAAYLGAWVAPTVARILKGPQDA